MTIRLIHSNDVTTNRADIATRYTDIFFDDEANSILLPDPKGMLETKLGATGTQSTSGYSIANTASTASWVNLGTWTTVNQGTTLYLRIVAHAGFNADTNQSQVTEVYFKTSNANSNIGGFYADGTATRNPALGSCNVAPSVIRVVQNSQTSYTFYGYFGTWSAGSHYTFSTDGSSAWAHNGALSVAPTGTTLDITPVASGTKTVAGYVNAGTFVTLDNIRATVTTTGNRGLSVATVAGTFTATISANYSCTGGGNGHSTLWPGATYTTTPSGSWFGYHFPNAGDGSTYMVNDYTNQRVYRIYLSIGPGYSNNFISIERLSDGITPPPPPVVAATPVAVGVAAPAPRV
jgi:hypothetical protein